MLERRKRGWDEHVTRMGAEKFVEISRDNIHAGRSPGRPKTKWSDLIPVKTGEFIYKEEERRRRRRKKNLSA